MSYIDQHNLSQESAFRPRVRVAMLTAAVNVSSEDVQTANHANRAALAKAVMNNPSAYEGPFCEAVTTNPVVTVDSSDSDILFTVNSLWDAMAGKG